MSRLESSGDTERKTAGDFSTSLPSEFLRHSCSSRNSRSIVSRRLPFVRINGCGSRVIAYDFFAVLLNEGSTKQRRPVFSHREHGAGNLSWTLHLTFSCQICRHKSGAICHVERCLTFICRQWTQGAPIRRCLDRASCGWRAR